jgi:hypothetical protein
MSPPSSSIGGLWRLHRSTSKTSTTTPTTHWAIVNKKQLDESLPRSPRAVGYLSQSGGLVGSGGIRRQKWPVPPSPMRALWALYPVKGHVVSQTWPSEMPQNATRLINRRLLQNCVYAPVVNILTYMLKGHSTPDSWLLTPLQTKRT